MKRSIATLSPGFMALHGNRLEELALTVQGWLARHPLGPLEEEVILVQSNGMAEWLKMELARLGGVCAAVRVELPGRFLWRTYRQVLGPRAVPRESPLDKVPMTWRLMKILPDLLPLDDFGPIRGYLRDDDPGRSLQLAGKLADLFDQYQNYRVDWLEAWTRGEEVLIGPDGRRLELPPEQRWQAHLWRAILATLGPSQADAIRPRLHRRVIERLQGPDPLREPLAGSVARRVVAFGMSHMPGTTLEALAALSRYSQVMLAIPNPCRYYWGDIMDGRELLRSQRRRQPARRGPDLALVSLAEMHRYAHPLLAAWGRQGRDFIRQLDAFDDAQATQRDFDLPRLDLFDEATESDQENEQTPLLQRVQRRILDLEPVGTEPVTALPAGDRSILFQVAHSAVRELEVLQDQLLAWLAAASASGQPLAPRDCVVMVPDIEVMAPAIRAVFGQYRRGDARYIPYDIADLNAKSSSTVIGAIGWLLRLPHQRGKLSELLDLLEVPAVAARFGVDEDQLPRLAHWMEGAGIRWGLDAGHRAGLGLDAAGDQNTAWFGQRRMLLGYATGSLADLCELDPTGDGIEPYDEPYDEIGGLEAELAGSLAHLLQTLRDWSQQCATPHTPSAWIELARDLLTAMFRTTDETDRQAVAALGEALTGLGTACDQAGFDEPLALPAFRQAWLEVLETPSLNRRFRAGGVTFCTLMPMRAIPFEAVCLVGMNDGDYPRRTHRSDFDLMGRPGQSRPGDRSRQQDDRQLMLEALLSARRFLYVSWTGRSVRDNSELPPSVLVAQLRDYLAAVWGRQAVAERTTEHPLQPFSRAYFEAGSHLLTYAREWRGAHAPDVTQVERAAAPAFTPDPAAPLDLQRLARFLRNPVKVYFRERLGVVFAADEEARRDTEPFTVRGLENHHLIEQQLKAWPVAAPVVAALGPLQAHITASLARLRRAGALPMGGFGALKQDELTQTLGAMAGAWVAARSRYPVPQPRIAIHVEHGGVVLADWIDPLFRGGDGTAWLQLVPAKLLEKNGSPRPDKLLDAWVRSLARAAGGHAMQGLMVGPDCTLEVAPLPQQEAAGHLQTLLDLWLTGMNTPLPLPSRTALAVASGSLGRKTERPATIYEGSEYSEMPGEGTEMCLARLYPDFETLAADGQLEKLAELVYGPLLQWVAHQVQTRPHEDAREMEVTAA